MEGRKSCSMMAVAFVGLLLLTGSPAVNGQLDCVTGILPSLLPCKGFLDNLLPILPSQDCCAAAKNFTGLGTTNSLCQCLKLNLLPTGILPFKLNLIPNLCSLTGLLPIVSCILEPLAPPSPTPSA